MLSSVIRRAVLLVLVTAIAASGTSAFAQSWKVSAGRNVGAMLPTDTRKLADGGTYLTGGSKQIVETEDPSYPLNGAAMECRWICRIPANGKDGACITLCGGVDKDGDLFSFRSLAFGAGSYEVGPGTGKFSKATGGGTFESPAVEDPSIAVTRWKGTLHLK